jgi:hypothetical protein
MAGRLSGMLANFPTKAHAYQLAAAALWGVILALIFGIIDYNGKDGRFDVEENWFFATVGLSAIMYAALSFLRNMVQIYQHSDKEEVEAEQ